MSLFEGELDLDGKKSDEIQHIHVSLEDMGYKGTWEDFCSPSKMDLDFPDNQTHEIRACREIICELKAKDRITETKIHLFVTYKFLNLVNIPIADFPSPIYCG